MGQRSIAWIALCALAGCEGPAGPEIINQVDGSVTPPPSDGAPVVVDASPSRTTKLGANIESAGVVFRLWAPHASAASVIGDFATEKVAMTAVEGIFEARVGEAKMGSQYHFEITTPSGNYTRTDPYCRELKGAECVVVDPARYVWGDASFVAPTRAASIVYELHVGSFAAGTSSTSVGTFSSARAKLPELAELGVNVIELMPTQHFAGTNGWGYNPHLYLAPNTSYGTPDDLRAFVDQAHKQGIAVWLDTVVNHADGSKRAPLNCFEAPCTGKSAGLYFFPEGAYAMTPWGPRPNYAEPQVAAMLVAAVDAWMDEFHGDGFRFDSVSNIRAIDGVGTTPLGRELLVTANDHIHARGGLSVAEDLKGYQPLTAASTSGGFGFDAQWDGFGYTVMNAIVPADDAVRDLAAIAWDLKGTYNNDSFARVLFTENHDIVGNGGARASSRIDANNPTSWTARKRSMLASTLLMTAPGVPMLFQGQESLATGTFSASPAPLLAPSATGLKIRAFYKDLLRLRRNLDGLAGGLLDASVDVFHQNDSAKVLAYRRYGSSGEDVVVIVNLRNKSYTSYDIGVADAGPWRIRLNTDSTLYGDDFVAGQTGAIAATKASKDGKPYTLSVQLGAYGAMVITH